MEEWDTHFASLLVPKEASIRAALSAIDKYGIKDALVVDGDGRLVGAVAENDIRRALLAGTGLDAPVYPLVREAPPAVKPSEGRAEALDLMRALGLKVVPVVDGEGRVVGVHTEHETIGVTPRDNWAVVMAGGRGTRLAPLTDEMPKPMLPVAGRPILERLVLHLVGSGVNRIFLSVNYLGNLIENHFGDGSQFGCTIEYLREAPDQPLGTGGALRLLHELGHDATAPLLVMNGDLVTAFSVERLLEAHASRDVVATIAVSEYQHQVPFGVLEASQERLLRIVEKPTRSWQVNAGIYVLEPTLLARIPRGELFPITDLFDDCLASDLPIGIWQMREHWQDIGRPHELAQARGERWAG